jgi:hypothetical protein
MCAFSRSRKIYRASKKPTKPKEKKTSFQTETHFCALFAGARVKLFCPHPFFLSSTIFVGHQTAEPEFSFSQ